MVASFPFVYATEFYEGGIRIFQFSETELPHSGNAPQALAELVSHQEPGANVIKLFTAVSYKFSY
jgi:hypothetical protein